MFYVNWNMIADILTRPGISKALLPAVAAVMLVCFLLRATLNDNHASTENTLPPEKWTMQTPVSEVLRYLGADKPAHYREAISPEQVETGRKLVFDGQLVNDKGEKTPILSVNFRCTDCHNVVREDPDLAEISDPAAKLQYAVTHNTPLLQGTTFAGMVNRESWYNGDYAKKYRFSPLVQRARRDLEKSIQLCCEQCSQGRKPEPWEMEAFLAYFWSLQWKIEDLDIPTITLASWKRAAVQNRSTSHLTAEIKSHYARVSPATFLKMPQDPKKGYPVDKPPDTEIGKQVFNQACMHCHDPAEGSAFNYFRDDEKTRKKLTGKFNSSSKNSVYGYIRLGTHPQNDEKLYMPNYTQERMSNFQIESLKAYLSN